MKDAKGHGSASRGSRANQPTSQTRDALGRTYSKAVRDHDSYPDLFPHAPNPEMYRTVGDSSSNAEAAQTLMSTLRSTQAPVHPAMQYGRDLSAPTDGFGLRAGLREDTIRTKQGQPGRGIDYES